MMGCVPKINTKTSSLQSYTKTCQFAFGETPFKNKQMCFINDYIKSSVQSLLVGSSGKRLVKSSNCGLKAISELIYIKHLLNC
jgi:hypothetical protein